MTERREVKIVEKRWIGALLMTPRRGFVAGLLAAEEYVAVVNLLR